MPIEDDMIWDQFDAPNVGETFLGTDSTICLSEEIGNGRNEFTIVFLVLFLDV